MIIKPRVIFILLLLTITALVVMSHRQDEEPAKTYIRINLLGYKPTGTKVAVWCSKEPYTIVDFQVVDVLSGRIVYTGKAGKAFGAYGPFGQTYRLDFSAFTERGKFLLQAGGAASPEFIIG